MSVQVKALGGKVEQLNRQVSDLVVVIDTIAADNAELLADKSERSANERRAAAKAAKAVKPSPVIADDEAAVSKASSEPKVVTLNELDVERIAAVMIAQLSADASRQDVNAASVCCAAVDTLSVSSSAFAPVAAVVAVVIVTISTTGLSCGRSSICWRRRCDGMRSTSLQPVRTYWLACKHWRRRRYVCSVSLWH
jgi:hypothetical protein